MEKDIDFRLYQKGIEFIQKEILTSPVALRVWPMCINSFVSSESSRKRLRDEYKNGQFDEVILKTLEEWIEKQNNKATLGELIQLLRNYDLNNLCGSLEAKAEDIKSIQIQSTSTAIIENDRIRNFWFGMTDILSFVVGRAEELEILHKLVTENRVEEYSSVALLTSVHGFGGIGKTTLAKMYAWKYKDYFDRNVIWIDSETFGSMQRAFEGVAKKLNLEAGSAIPSQSLTYLTKAVYSTFEGSKCLFIFDNVEDFDGSNGIKHFLPTGIIAKPYLLLTSRRKDCFLTKRVLPLHVLNRSDSIKLIKEYIPGASDEAADELATRCEGVPLAIRQALAYIKKIWPAFQLSSSSEAAKIISSFLEDYNQIASRIYLYQSGFNDIDGYAKCIYSICEMSLKKMECEDGGKLAKHMLRYISFLDPTFLGYIHVSFFLYLPYQFESDLHNIQKIVPRWDGENTLDPSITLQLLSSYSLIDITTKMKIKVHRLVQDAIRSVLQENEELFYIKGLLDALDHRDASIANWHWHFMYKSCKFEASKSCISKVIQETFGSH